jgi:hypothetical protein
MKITDINDWDHGEFLFRHYHALPTADKIELVQKLIKKAAERGATAESEYLDWLDGPDAELLVGIVGGKFPISDDEFVDALMTFMKASPGGEPFSKK